MLHLYLSTTGTDGDFCGTSAETACKSLKGAAASVKDHMAKREYVEKAAPRPYTVHVADGEYSGEDNMGVEFKEVNVTIVADNIGKVHFKGDRTERCMLFNGVGWNIAEIHGIKFSGYRAEVGGAVYLNGTTGTIADSEFNGNEASFSGGGLQVRGENTFRYGRFRWVVIRTKFIGNKAGRWGGGMFANIAWTYVKDCEFIDNESESSGGHYAARAGNSTWWDTKMTGGKSLEFGGAMYNRNHHCDIVRLHFEDNTSDRGGAVTSTVASRFSAFNSVFTKNHGRWRGGAASLGEDGAAVFRDCKLIDNKAGNSGGAIWTNKVRVAFPGAELRGNRIEPIREEDKTYWTHDDFGRDMKWGTDIHCQNAELDFEGVAYLEERTATSNPMRCDKYPLGSRCYAWHLDEEYCIKPPFTIDPVPPTMRERFQSMLPDEARLFMEDDMNFVVVVLGFCATGSVILFWIAFAIAPSPEEVRAATVAASKVKAKKDN